MVVSSNKNNIKNNITKMDIQQKIKVKRSETLHNNLVQAREVISGMTSEENINGEPIIVRYTETPIGSSETTERSVMGIGNSEGGYDLQGDYRTTISRNLPMPNDVGGIKAGTTCGDLEGKMISEILDDLLFPTINPKLKLPSNVTISKVSGDSINEIGDTVRTPFKCTYGDNQRGYYTVNGEQTNWYRGNAITYVFDFNDTEQQPTNGPTSNIIDIIMNEYGSKRYRVKVNYEEGEDALNNKGVKIHDKQPSGTTAYSSYTTIRWVYPWYATTGTDCGQLVKQDILNDTNTNHEFTLTTQVAGSPNKFAIHPDKLQIKTFQVFNTATNKFDNTSVSTYFDAPRRETINGQIMDVYESKDKANVGSRKFNIISGTPK